MQKLTPISSTVHIWFWSEIKKIKWNVFIWNDEIEDENNLIWMNQVQFWNKIFDILWCYENNITDFKNQYWELLKGSNLTYFVFHKNIYGIYKWGCMQRIVKYKILEILDL